MLAGIEQGSGSGDALPSPDFWLGRNRPKHDGTLRLFCFPFAGTGASMFATWPKRLPGEVEVWPIQMPGREARISEQPFTKLSSLVPRIADVILPYLEKPFAFYGHSMGALISFELARELRRRGSPLPGALLLSGRYAPHLTRERPPRYDLPDDEFLLKILALNGNRDMLADELDLMRLMMPTIRADFEICETHEYVDEACLDCPLTVWGALRDPEASVVESAAWRDQTTASFTLRIFDGDHFFPFSCQELFMKSVVEELGRLGGLARLKPAAAK